MELKAVAYVNDAISALKGADRVRKRPAVIFGLDKVEMSELTEGARLEIV